MSRLQYRHRDDESNMFALSVNQGGQVVRTHAFFGMEGFRLFDIVYCGATSLVFFRHTNIECPGNMFSMV